MVTVTAGASGAWETLSLPIAKGDELVVTVEMFYEANADNRNNSAPNFNVFLQNLPDYGSSTVDGQTSLSPFQLSNFSLGVGLTLPSQSNDNVPNAYLAVIIYDEDGSVEKEEYRHVQVGDQTGWGTRTIDLTSFLSTTSVNKGRAEVFVYNQSNTDIWFDNLTIQHKGALIAQENHYYPFGMNIVGIEKRGQPDHKYQYNGKEKQEEFNLNWIDYGWRNYDAQLGRWHSIDLKAEKYAVISPYAYALDNPISYIDPDGQEVVETDSSTVYTGLDAQNKFAELTGQTNTDEGGDEEDPPGLGFPDPQNWSERFINNLYAKSYLNSAYDFYQQNKDNVVARGTLGNSAFLILLEKSGKLRLYTFTNDALMSGVENVFDLYASIVTAELLYPLGEAPEDSDVQYANIFGATRRAAREAFFRAFPKFAKAAEKLEVHHRLPFRYRNLFGDDAIDNLSNLQALPTRVHRSVVTPLWNRFSATFPNATREQVRNFSQIIDMLVSDYANNINRISNF